jgi:hypothetical protein
MNYYDCDMGALQPYHALQGYGLGHYQPNRQIVVQPPPDRLQAVITAGAVKLACESSIAKTEASRAEWEAASISAIRDLPETTETKVTLEGWWIFKRRVETVTKHTPTQAEQESHRAATERGVKESADRYCSPSAIIKTLHALASHFPPSQPMPLEGQYLTEISPFLEPFESVAA